MIINLFNLFSQRQSSNSIQQVSGFDAACPTMTGQARTDFGRAGFPFVGQIFHSSGGTHPWTNKFLSGRGFLHLCISKDNDPDPKNQNDPILRKTKPNPRKTRSKVPEKTNPPIPEKPIQDPKDQIRSRSKRKTSDPKPLKNRS